MVKLKWHWSHNHSWKKCDDFQLKIWLWTFYFDNHTQCFFNPWLHAWSCRFHWACLIWSFVPVCVFIRLNRLVFYGFKVFEFFIQDSNHPIASASNCDSLDALMLVKTGNVSKFTASLALWNSHIIKHPNDPWKNFSRSANTRHCKLAFKHWME